MKAVFLDKDGTIIENIPYNTDLKKIKLTKNAGIALKMLKDKGYKIIIVTNQSGVAKGLFKEKSIFLVKEKIQKLLSQYRVKFDDFFYCPHYPNGKVLKYSFSCLCRKPMSGLIEKGIKKFNLDPKKSWMIGDILDDIEAGKRVGNKTILINNGNETKWELSNLRNPEFVVSNLKDAAEIIIKKNN